MGYDERASRTKRTRCGNNYAAHATWGRILRHRQLHGTVNENSAESDGSANAAGDHLQVFLYRIPKENHGALASVERKLATIYCRHGVLSVDHDVFGAAPIFEGFRGLSAVLGAREGEEIWIETLRYRDEEDSQRAMAAIGEDPEAGPLWGGLATILSPKVSIVMGDADRLEA